MYLLIKMYFIRYCHFLIAPKTFGEWENEGSCQAEGDDPTCGAGLQIQKRTCTDGTIDKCTSTDEQRAVTCAAAGTALPVCSRFSMRFLSIL